MDLLFKFVLNKNDASKVKLDMKQISTFMEFAIIIYNIPMVNKIGSYVQGY